MTETELKERSAAIPNEELADLVEKEMIALAESYGQSHHMSIPPSPRDTDMLIGELLRRFRKTIPVPCEPNS